MDKMIQMVLRMVMRQVLNRGINKGFDMALGGQKGRKRRSDYDDDDLGQVSGGHGVSDADRAEMQEMRAQQKRVKQAAKVGRRIGRM